MANYPKYLGFDVSAATLSRCRETFDGDESKSFRPMDEYQGEQGELALSLDVIYHLVEDDIFELYVRRLFNASTRYVIIYSSDSEDNRGYEGTHVKHRKFTAWVAEHLANWKLIEHIPNWYPYRGDYRKGSFADFFVYEKNASPGA